MQQKTTAIITRCFAIGIAKIKAFWSSNLQLFQKNKFQLHASAEYFNTPIFRKKWWENLDEDWRKVFRFQVYPNLDFNGNDIAGHVFELKKMEINLKGITQLNGLQGLSNLEHLIIYNYQSTDLSILRNLKKLTFLEIIDSDFSCKMPISAISNIIDLRLENCQLTNTLAFKHLKKLKTLQLTNNNIVDINPLSSAVNLEFLSLQDNPITDFNPLSHLTNTIIVLSFYQKFNLQELQNNNIQVELEFTNKHPHDETFFQNN